MTDLTTPGEDRDHLPFERHHAFIIGIDAYEKVSPLKTAVNDARQLANVLGAQQHFLVHPPLLDATGDAIRELLRTTLREQVGKDDRVFFYFAGHGIAADGDDGPAGYIVPADADPTDVKKTFIAMADLQQALEALPCRHLLLVLDCCFSGAFKWSSQYRAIGSLMPKRIYKERFDRFIQDPAWQVITSAAHDQKALDVLDGKPTGDRGLRQAEDNTAHSPFAKALFEALAGAADVKGERESDGMITATELYAYIRDQIEPQAIEAGQRLRQTPGFFPLKKHDKGEFIFLHPRHRLNLPPTPKRSPYKGLASFDEEDQLLFYGRDRVIKELREKARDNKLLVISGASGTGKSSVIKAGLLPVLRAEGCRILPVIRPGAEPLAALEQALKEVRAAPAAAETQRAILLIDQFEEVITRCADPEERREFDARLRRLLDEEASIHRLILTVRSDFEPQLNGGALKEYWKAGRCTAAPFSLEELKEVIVMPTMQEVLIFDPPQLVDEIIAEVVQSPGALPLLSYALSELYEAYRTSGRQDRALKKEDYDKLGGVMGALRTKADTLYKELQADEQNTMRKLMLRMVSVEGDLASKRAPMTDLRYSDAETALVDKVVEKLVDARLIVKGPDYIEPAHDALVRAWKTLHEWIHEVGREKLILGAKLNAVANDFAQTTDNGLLWDYNPNLPVVQEELNKPWLWFNAREITFIEQSLARKKKLEEEREEQERRLRSALEMAKQTNYVANMNLANQAQAENASRVNELLNTVLPADANDQEDLRSFPWYYLWHNNHNELATIAGHAGDVASIAASPDGRMLASASGDNTVKLWDAGTRQEIATLSGHESRVTSVAFSPDGKTLASASDDRTVKLWDTGTRQESATLRGHAGDVTAVAFSPDGKTLASASGDNTVKLWDTISRREAATLSGHAGDVRSVAFSPDGRTLASAGDDMTIRLWDTSKGKELATLEGHEWSVRSVAFSRDGKTLASAGGDATVRLWNVAKHKELAALSGHAGWVRSVAFSPDGRTLASAGADGTVKLWDPGAQQERATLKGHSGEVKSVVFLDGKTLASASADRTVKLWAPGTLQESPVLTGHSDAVHCVAFSPDGRTLASAGGDNTVRLWNAATREESATLAGHEDWVSAVAFSPDGKTLASASGNDTVKLWDTRTLQELATLEGAFGPVAFSPEGRTLAFTSGDNAVQLWDADTQQEIATLTGHSELIESIAFSPDGGTLASAGRDKTVRLWDTGTGQTSATLRGHSDFVYSVAFSLDGKTLASASADGSVKLWDTRTRQEIATLTGHSYSVRSVAFSPDGKTLASASSDNTVKLWDLRTRQELATLKEHTAYVRSVAFSPDRKMLASASYDQTVRLWIAATDEKVAAQRNE